MTAGTPPFDLVTANVDLPAHFAGLAREASPALRDALRRSLRTLTVLDPTCGTG